MVLKGPRICVSPVRTYVVVGSLVVAVSLVAGASSYLASTKIVEAEAAVGILVPLVVLCTVVVGLGLPVPAACTAP